MLWRRAARRGGLFARSDASRTRMFRTSRTSLPAGDSRLSEVGRLARGPSSRQDRPSGSPLGGPGDSVFFPRRGRFPYGFSPSPCRGQKAAPDVRTSDSLGARPREVLTTWNPLLGGACIAAQLAEGGSLRGLTLQEPERSGRRERPSQQGIPGCQRSGAWPGDPPLS